MYATLVQHWTNTGSVYGVCRDVCWDVPVIEDHRACLGKMAIVSEHVLRESDAGSRQTRDITTMLG